MSLKKLPTLKKHLEAILWAKVEIILKKFILKNPSFNVQGKGFSPISDLQWLNLKQELRSWFEANS